MSNSISELSYQHLQAMTNVNKHYVLAHALQLHKWEQYKPRPS